ncbi:glycosyltransferase involved in cell wall biosynthesis [Deinococcus metalli]|uniref:Glycosyltransferase involved in cell wall biosynthesis n=1 Tax=Deinococcus metalli TaxID=1141878 RepID=A0A7W8KCU0_9DEIO|nr:GT4 family glycosyltransferase PelF [Deinococcus metalli]MBB5375842.1 glycosyltransferase involved in cell wall biosynthesis [Deinococcus metalli]GHF36638.1 lipopolysaccharide glycosyltransferase, putative [Deinococcus metalli]
MQIALLCEGTYPHMHGGVSVWCEQLIAGLPEHTFDVYAISGPPLDARGLTLPGNVRSVTNVPLWAARPPALRGRTRAADLHEGYGQLLYSLFVAADRPEMFLAGLRRLFDYAQHGDLGRGLDTGKKAAQLFEMWRVAARDHAPDAKRQSGLLLPPTLADALQAHVWLEHFLRPLSCPAPYAAVCHATSNGLSPLVAFGSKWRYGTPFVLTEHGIYLRERYLELRYSGHTPAFKSFLLRFYQQLSAAAYRMADLITPGSHYNERWEVMQGAEPGRIRAVYNGVNPAFFPQAPAEPTEPTISWVGRVDPLKDLETLIRAFGEVRAQLPTAKLRMFGGTPRGNEDYARHCQSVIDELGLRGQATFEGRVTDVVDAYHAGHLVALTSISEGFPYTLIEAMAVGRATVSTDVGGVTEAVGDAGLVVPSRDPGAFARASLRLLGDTGLREQLGRAARHRVLSEFTLDSFLSVYRRVYPLVSQEGSARVARSGLRAALLDSPAGQPLVGAVA